MKLSVIKSKIQQIFYNTKGRIALVLILPVVMILVFLLCNNLYHLNRYKTLIVTNYSNELNTFLSDAEEKMNVIISDERFITTNQDIDFMLKTNTKPAGKNAEPAISVIKKAEMLSNLIDSIAIYNRNGNFVVTSTGLYDADAYFSNVNSYDKYPIVYWSEYRTVTGDVKALPPTVITNNTSAITKTIVPFVFTAVGNADTNNIIIFNISVDTLFESFETYKFTPNTNMYMIDNATGDVYSGGNVDIPKPNSKTIRSIQSSLRSNTDIIKMNGKKYLSICSTKRSNVWNYTYMVAVPYKDINRSVLKIMVSAFLFMIALSFVLFMYILFGTKILYSPWQKLGAIATKGRKTEYNNEKVLTNIEEFLESSLLSMAEENKNLEENLSAVLPMGQERYLIDVLNDNCSDEELFNHLSFRYDYFASVSVSVKLNPVYACTISEQEITQINIAVRQLIKGVFSGMFVAYELPGENNMIYLLLNLENDLCMSRIQDDIAKIKKILEVDEENIDVTFGVGGIYRDLDGLKLTHQESVSNLMKELTYSKVRFSSVNTEYVFTANREGVLVNYITAGHFDKAVEFLNNVYDNISMLPMASRCRVYEDIINSLKKVMTRKGIDFSSEAADYMIHMLKTSKNIDDDEIKEYISNQIDGIAETMKTYSSKIDITAIIEYIDNHYTEDIGLDELAEMNSTTSKYLSKRIKEYLNVPFKKYLTSLRIHKAKELLETTDITISDLYSKVGFQNRSAFISAFKLSTGIAPSEYRKTYGNKNQ